jgi:hypothetical protein
LFSKLVLKELKELKVHKDFKDLKVHKGLLDQ